MDLPSKTETAQRLFTRPEGATMDEVIAATGDYQYRALKRLKSKGYRIKRAREGRATRYFAVAPAQESFEASVGADGKMTIPKEVREKLGLRSGHRLQFTIEDGDRVVVTPVSRRLSDLAGILGKPKRSLTLEEMDEAIADAAVARYRRAVGGGRR
jgi:AbrB family looped-hinge helix DNA binding protein